MDAKDLISKVKEEKEKRLRINENLLKSGVYIMDPDTAYIDESVKILPGTVVYPNTILSGNTTIGADCVIGPNTTIENCTIGDNNTVKASFLYDSTIGSGCSIGPFSYVRPNCTVGDNVKIGDFVELKAAKIGNGTKASHLTYIGDAFVGEKVNFGCGTVVVNYDGANKHKTYIGDNAFIGCNSNLVSPVTIGDWAYTAAGSTITDEVPANTLAIARARQIIKENWQRKVKEENKK